MKILYKYLSKERVQVLECLQIRFSPPACMNDLFEVSPSITDNTELDYIKALSADQFVDQLAFFWDSSPEFRNMISRDLFLSLGRDPVMREKIYAQLGNIPADLVKKKRDQFMNSELGILSLSESCESETMWAHYSSDHTGFAIGFDSQHPFLHTPSGNDREYNNPHKVRYTDARPECGIATSTTLDRFLIKSTAWSYENEWRVLKLLRGANKEIEREGLEYPIHLFSIPPDCIRQVCFGSRIHQTLKERIKSLVRSCPRLSHVQLFQAEPCTSTFRILIKEVPNNATESKAGGWSPI